MERISKKKEDVILDKQQLNKLTINVIIHFEAEKQMTYSNICTNIGGTLPNQKEYYKGIDYNVVIG